MHDCFVVSVSKGQRPAQCFCDSLKLSVFRCHAALFHYVTCAVSFLSSFWGVYITWIIETTRFLVLLKNVVALPEKAVTVGFILSVLISYLLSYYPGDMDTWRDAYLFFLLWKLVLWQSRNHDVSCKTITGVDFFFFKYVYRTDTGDGCGGGEKKVTGMHSDMILLSLNMFLFWPSLQMGLKDRCSKRTFVPHGYLSTNGSCLSECKLTLLTECFGISVAVACWKVYVLLRSGSRKLHFQSPRPPVACDCI